MITYVLKRHDVKKTQQMDNGWVRFILPVFIWLSFFLLNYTLSFAFFSFPSFTLSLPLSISPLSLFLTIYPSLPSLPYLSLPPLSPPPLSLAPALFMQLSSPSSHYHTLVFYSYCFRSTTFRSNRRMNV